LPAHTINTPSTMSYSQYFEMTQKSDISSESEHAVSMSRRISTLVPTVRDTDVITEPASAATRKEKTVLHDTGNLPLRSSVWCNAQLNIFLL
jgi:hypothetical protein